MKKHVLWLSVAVLGMGVAPAAWGADTEKKAADAKAADAPKAETAAPAEPAAQPAKAEVKAEATAPVVESGASEQGLLGPVSLGPSVALALPHPINLGIEGRLFDHFGFGVAYGFLPQMSFMDASVKIGAPELRARVFPFAGSFFLGASFGRRAIVGSKDLTTTVAAQSVTANAALDATTYYFQPTIGWRWGGKTGFIFGIDVGYQVSMSASSALTLTPTTANVSTAAIEATSDYQAVKADLEEIGRDVGSASLPAVTAIHIGYQF